MTRNRQNGRGKKRAGTSNTVSSPKIKRGKNVGHQVLSKEFSEGITEVGVVHKRQEAGALETQSKKEYKLLMSGLSIVNVMTS